MTKAIPNLIQPDLKILFIGINPGLRSAEVRHHFAGRSNRFWRFLFDSGLTPQKLQGEEDFQLLRLGYGITNIIDRPTASAAELLAEEYKQGAIELVNLLKEFQPGVAAYLGKDIYKTVAQRKELHWGLQAPSVVEGVIDFLLPNPSGLNRMPLDEQLGYYKQLKEITPIKNAPAN